MRNDKNLLGLAIFLVTLGEKDAHEQLVGRGKERPVVGLSSYI